MKKGEKTKTYIIELAIKEAYKVGFDNLSFNGLAKICDLSQPAFYKHFKNKTDLLFHCLLYSAESGRNFIDSYEIQDTDAEKKLKNYLLGNLRWAKAKPEEAHILISMYYYAKNDSSIKNTFDLITETGIKRISTILLAGTRENLWSIDRAQPKASAIQSLLMGEIIKRFHNKKLGTKDEDFLGVVFGVL